MQDRFERFVVSITELHRYLQKLKELEMGQMDLKAGYTMCLYYLGKHPEGLTATQLTELCKEDKVPVFRRRSSRFMCLGRLRKGIKKRTDRNSRNISTSFMKTMVTAGINIVK